MSDNPIIKDDELVLKTSALQSAGSANGTGIAAGPTGKMAIKVCVFVSVVASGGTLDLHLEESDDDSSYTDIANSAFTQITAVTASPVEQLVKMSKKYIRIVSTVGTNDVTWEAYITTAD